MSTVWRLRARWILPIDGPPIENGWIEIAGGRIQSVGRFHVVAGCPDPSVIDLGDVALLPGLVNAHTHLEFSDLAAPIGRANIPLADWIIEVVRSRENSVQEGPVHKIAVHKTAVRDVLLRGAREAADSGSVLLGEIATTPWPAWNSPSGLPEIVAFAEVLGLSPQRAADRFDLAEKHLAPRSGAAGYSPGISPHAPYSTPPELIARCVDLAIASDCPVAMHVAESPDERELMQSGRGRFADNLTSLGFDLSQTFPWPDRDPVSALIRLLARAPAAILVHGNDLRPAEIELIAAHRSISVVYCPRTHDFFGYPPHPVADLIAAGIPVGLGTDSRASNPDLQLWREVRWLLERRQDIAPEKVLEMATLGGAIAMRRDHDYGSLAPRRKAAFAIVPTTASTIASLYSDFAASDAVSGPSVEASANDACHN